MENSDDTGIQWLRRRLLDGSVIPAHPLALTPARRFDERRQRALSRYYLEAGAGGLAVGVHTTQFEIHAAEVGLYEPVLRTAADEARRHGAPPGKRPVLVAGIVGETEQAVREARLAASLGYDCGLLGLGALRSATDHRRLEHCRAVGREIPLFGFYLQPAAGGVVLGYDFWRRFCEIDNVVAIKIAVFDRYRTIDVVRALASAGRESEIALYTGNDDNILLDLVTPFRVPAGSGGSSKTLHFVGGLLGQWAVWTRRAVELHAEARLQVQSGGPIPLDWLARNTELTDANGALFDRANEFAGCIPGIHEALRRQGLLEGGECIDPGLKLSPGQVEEIDRVEKCYTHLRDDEFVAARLSRWLG